MTHHFCSSHAWLLRWRANQMSSNKNQLNSKLIWKLTNVFLGEKVIKSITQQCTIFSRSYESMVNLKHYWLTIGQLNITKRGWRFSKMKFRWHIEAETKWTPFRRRYFQMHFVEWNIWNPINISLKFVPMGQINNIPALAQIMAWRRLCGKPLSEPIMVSLLTHICVTQPQWVSSYQWKGHTLHSHD